MMDHEKFEHVEELFHQARGLAPADRASFLEEGCGGDLELRAEIESLLGPADETSYFRRWDFVYWLGPERGFIRIDSEWLVLRFDAEDRVSEFRLVRD